QIDSPKVETDVRHILEEMVMAAPAALSHDDRNRLVHEIEHEIFGLGPLEATDIRFRDDAHLMQIIERIVTRVGRRVDEHSPMVDARLPDGSRVNAIIPPLALDGPILSIRRFGAERLTMRDLIELNSVPAHVVEVLEACVKARLNILVS